MYRHLDLAAACAEIGKGGCAGVDLWSSPGMCEHVAPQSKAREITRIASDNGLRIAALTAYHTLSPTAPIARFLWSIEFAAEVGAPRVVTNGVDWKGDLRSFTSHLEPALKLAENRGVKIAFENHSGQPFSATQSDLLRMAEEIASPAFGFTIAPAHLAIRGSDAAETIRRLGRRVSFFYAWDHVPGEHEDGGQFRWPPVRPEHMFPGKGRLDFRSFVAALLEIDYDRASGGWLNVRSYPRYCLEPWETKRITGDLKGAVGYLSHLLKTEEGRPQE